MPKHIAIINGPNLNRLGHRDPEIYGSETFEQTLEDLRSFHPRILIDYYQSNSEGEIIDILQSLDCGNEILGVVLNPGAYAHYSYAIADALRDMRLPVVEVHISNIHAREGFRAASVTAAAAKAIISGCGRQGYELAIQYLMHI